MDEKFKKHFGPNPSRQADIDSEAKTLMSETDDSEYKRALARVRNKRRVLGFLILAVGVLVVFPWIIDPNPEFAQRSAQTEIPLVKTKPSTAKIALQSEPGAAKPVEGYGRKPVESGARTTVAPVAVKPVTNPAPVKETVKAPVKPQAQEPVKAAASVKKPALTPIPAQAKGVYVIQVIATGNRDGALKKQKKLEALGLPVFLERVRRQNTDLWRVRVGRFADQNQAKAAAKRLTDNGISHGGILTEKVK
jgi:DedD protein